MSYKNVEWLETFQGLLWTEIFQKWNAGDIPKIPYNIDKPFLWRTSAINNKKNTFYREEFFEDKRLKNLKTDYNNLRFFNKPLLLNDKKHNLPNGKKKPAIGTYNLGKDAKLIVPTIVKDKNFTNIYHFMKNADIEQQKALWKLVIKETNNMLKKHDNIWINTQGLGDHYLHIRLDTKPKYYEQSKLKNIISNKQVSDLYYKHLKSK